LQRERRVDDVRRCQAVVDPAALGAELLGDRVDEGREIVVGRRLDLRDPLGRRRDGVLADRCDVVGRNHSDLRPGIERRELHVEPAGELALLRPAPAHSRTAVAGDHSGESRAASGGHRQTVSATAAYTSRQRSSELTSTHSTAACAPTPAGPNSTVGTPAAAINAASVQNGSPTTPSAPEAAARVATSACLSSSSNGSRATNSRTSASPAADRSGAS